MLHLLDESKEHLHRQYYVQASGTHSRGFGGNPSPPLNERNAYEQHQRGPIACGIAVPADLEKYTGGIYEDKTGDQNIVHDISIVGFGVQDGKKYWTVRNSWGTHFGEDGFVRVIRGINNIAIETDCAWATIKDTWTEDKRHKLTLSEKYED